MAHTAATSPYYSAWVGNAPRLFERARRAVIARDLRRSGWPLRKRLRHACIGDGRYPALIYFNPITLAIGASAVAKPGTQAYVTMDAGPHVKVLSRAADASVASALREVVAEKVYRSARRPAAVKAVDPS
jgi:diphosphomevalonate decarboxylase